MAVCQFAFGTMLGDNIPAMATNGCTVEAEAVGGSSIATTAAASAAQNVVRVASDTLCYVSFGAAPNAGTDPVRFLVGAGSAEYFRIKAGDKAAVIAA